MFPDDEAALIALLQQFVAGSANIGTTTPATLDGATLPFIQVSRFGGGDDGVTDDGAIDVDVLAPTRAAAINKARQIHAFLIGGPHYAAGVLIDRVTTQVGPVERPRTAGTIRRFGGTYTVSARRLST